MGEEFLIKLSYFSLAGLSLWILGVWVLRWLTEPKEFKKIPARNNWNGVPEPDLTWQEVSDGCEAINPIIPFTFEVDPDVCPVCSGPLTDYKSDWQVHGPDEKDGQFDVVGLYCIEGHWTHLTWA